MKADLKQLTLTARPVSFIMSPLMWRLKAPLVNGWPLVFWKQQHWEVICFSFFFLAGGIGGEPHSRIQIPSALKLWAVFSLSTPLAPLPVTQGVPVPWFYAKRPRDVHLPKRACFLWSPANTGPVWILPRSFSAAGRVPSQPVNYNSQFSTIFFRKNFFFTEFPSVQFCHPTTCKNR